MGLRLYVLLALATLTNPVSASGLQVSPITLTLAATQNAEGLWLSNTGQGSVQAQVRVYRWTQEDGQDKLTPTRELIVSPPMLQVPAGGRQLIRVIRSQAPSHPVELAYRVVIDELPVQALTEPQKAGGAAQGLQFVLSYSLPIFLSPAQTSNGAAQAPRLTWQVLHEGKGPALQVSNNGATHAQLAGLQGVNADGKRVAIHQGLLGYVLPGARMRWPLKSSDSIEPGTTIEVQVNDRTEQHRVEEGAPAR